MVTFNRDASYVNALDTIKDSIVESRADDFSVTDTPSALSESNLPAGAYKSSAVSVKAATDYSKYL